MDVWSMFLKTPAHTEQYEDVADSVLLAKPLISVVRQVVDNEEQLT